MLVNGIAEVRQVEPAKGAVPVAAVALAAIECPASAGEHVRLGRLAAGDALADFEHAAVHLMDFGILHEEIAPETAAEKTLDLARTGIAFQRPQQTIVSLQARRRERPLGH